MTILAICAKGTSKGDAETLEIIPAVVVRFQSSAGKFHQIEQSVDLKEWTPLDTIAGDGRIASRTVEVRPNSNRFFRMRDEGHSMLSSLSVSGPDQALAPTFSPDIYRYSVTTNGGPIRIRAGVGEGRLRIGGRDLPAGGEIAAEPGSDGRVWLDAVTDAGRITRYEIVPVPTNFPSISITNNRAGTDREVIFMTAVSFARRVFYAMAVDDHGVPFRYFQEPGFVMNFHVNANGFISYTRDGGPNQFNRNNGDNLVFDPYFNLIGRYNSVGLNNTGVHCFEVTQRGTYQLISYPGELRPVEGVSTNVLFEDAAFQEIGMDGRVVLQWNSWGRIALTNLLFKQGDYVHANWLTEDRDGNFLLSLRRASQIVKIDRATGNILWTLGPNGDFRFENDPFNGFCGQHRVSITPEGNILMFDNRNLCGTTGQGEPPEGSRVVEYRLDFEKKTATLVWDYFRKGQASTSQGGVVPLKNGRYLITWGRAPHIVATEIDRSGKVYQDIVLNEGNGSTWGYLYYKYDRDEVPGIRDHPPSGPL